MFFSYYRAGSAERSLASEISPAKTLRCVTSQQEILLVPICKSQSMLSCHSKLMISRAHAYWVIHIGFVYEQFEQFRSRTPKPKYWDGTVISEQPDNSSNKTGKSVMKLKTFLFCLSNLGVVKRAMSTFVR